MKIGRLILAFVISLPMAGISGEQPAERSPAGPPEKPREKAAADKPILDLGASDGVFYRVTVYPDLSVRGYTRHSGVVAGLRARCPKVPSLEVADRARAAIVNAAKLVMELQSVTIRPTLED